MPYFFVGIRILFKIKDNTIKPARKKKKRKN